MAEEESSRPIRLMNFVSEEQLDEAKKARGERVEDGTAQRDRPLFEILRENKDKQDAEFNERFKHRPPKALDEDETEFLDNLEMSRKEYEQQLADEEAQQLRSFQAAVAAKSTIVLELKETPPVPVVQVGQMDINNSLVNAVSYLKDMLFGNENECDVLGLQPKIGIDNEQKSGGRKNPPTRPLGMIVKVKPQPKKAKIDQGSVERPSEMVKKTDIGAEKSPEPMKTSNGDTNNADDASKIGLVSYSDESEDDD
ncbi:hypothetical protein JRO89_XS01G0350000 [Xanthoceras sorbifolium]|uniref:FAM192A/Fyv6 N-terminal domain-containing protein n=1 Tax=Xanthoceras sorbifolium TaxID=99658 RepID=A0ABQ8IN87_9ROSI|nr:hypothetical protein JRO89_XS01G0350000 [Xanthoceras sorbifolium]